MHGPDSVDRGLARAATAGFYVLAAVCVALLGADLLYSKHVDYAFEGWLGFFPAYGSGACVFIVYAATLLRRLVKRDEDYYD